MDKQTTVWLINWVGVVGHDISLSPNLFTIVLNNRLPGPMVTHMRRWHATHYIGVIHEATTGIHYNDSMKVCLR